jgi:3-deoxy-manno-octulosonate cytidylyltransferase (CMP-KDO synthetase)
MKAIAVIPARLASTRLPRKMLREIAGEPLLALTYQAVKRCPQLDAVVVATDSDEIFQFCQRRGFDARMTSTAHRSGTERAHEISTLIAADIYIDVQGDEPLTRPEHISALIDVMRPPEVEVGTLKTPAAEVDIHNPGAVKVVTDSAGRALYFSRATIPFDRDGNTRAGNARDGNSRDESALDGSRPAHHKHLGFYAFRKRALDKFVSWPESSLERTERLEQLRFLENGVAIYVAETPFDTVGVDTEEDVKRVEAILKGKQ